MLEFLEEVLLDTGKDLAKLLPFLFLSYLLMELLEHKAGDKMTSLLRRTGHFGPFLGGILGIVPQCGFSAAASGFYAGRVITLGTLFSVYLSTSDEMLPILIAGGTSLPVILKILSTKCLLGILMGFLVDLVLRLCGKGAHGESIHVLCEEGNCHCERGIFRSALHHTLEVLLFLVLVMLCLNTAIFFIGKESIGLLFSSLPVLGHLLASLVGLIPNCASSVVITSLYMEGVISTGCMMAGLLTGSGVGLLVLFRVNKSKRESLFILLALYGIGAVLGMLLDLVGLVF